MKRALIRTWESGPLATYRFSPVDPEKLKRQVEQVDFDGTCYSDPEHWGVRFDAYINGEGYPSIRCRISEEILDECLGRDRTKVIDDFKAIFRKHQERIYDKAEERIRQGGRVALDKDKPHSTRLLFVFKREDFI